MPQTVFVGNLSYHATEDELRALFERCGAVTRIHIPTDPGTDRRRGYAFVDFDALEHAETAVRTLDQHELRGRVLNLGIAKPRTHARGRGGRR